MAEKEKKTVYYYTVHNLPNIEGKSFTQERDVWQKNGKYVSKLIKDGKNVKDYFYQKIQSDKNGTYLPYLIQKYISNGDVSYFEQCKVNAKKWKSDVDVSELQESPNDLNAKSVKVKEKLNDLKKESKGKNEGNNQMINESDKQTDTTLQNEKDSTKNNSKGE